jgi:toxin ParE1/3/4
VRIGFHPLAERELIAAAKYFEKQASGLGAEFIRQIERTLIRITSNPRSGTIYHGDLIRRALVRRFPFAVVYQIKDSDLIVLAVMHLRRRPGYWKRRARIKPPTSPSRT